MPDVETGARVADGAASLLERAAPSEVVQVAGDICGLHAPVMSSAELSLWARIDALERDAVQEALWTHRTLVKLWAARGTLYVLPSAEPGIWLSALGTQTKLGNVGHPQIDALANAVGRALPGRIMTGNELALAVERLTARQSSPSGSVIAGDRTSRRPRSGA